MKRRSKKTPPVVVQFAPVETERERHWRLFHSIIPADSLQHGRKRTPYFYRLQAINWARTARELGWFDGGRMRTTAISIAKMYLADFRKMKGAAV